jgi:L-histidine Nalpha-methyltransferase
MLVTRETRAIEGEGETIFMEVSQKYIIPEVEELAINSGFRQMREFMDSKRWFLDALWLAV